MTMPMAITMIVMDDDDAGSNNDDSDEEGGQYTGEFTWRALTIHQVKSAGKTCCADLKRNENLQF